MGHARVSVVQSVLGWVRHPPESQGPPVLRCDEEDGSGVVVVEVGRRR